MPSRSSRSAGFSLLELLTAVVLIGIILGFAVPSMDRTLLLIRARSALNRVSSAIFQTRMEAVAEGRTVELVLVADPDRCITGYHIRRPGGGAGLVVDLGRDLRGLCLRHGRSPRDSTIGFNSRGILRGDNSTFWFTDPTVPDRLVISIAGRVRRTP